MIVFFFKLPISSSSNPFPPVIRWSGEWGRCALYICVSLSFEVWWMWFLLLFNVHFCCWLYAQLLTSSGVYNNKPAKTQISCHTDRAGLFTAAPWWDFTNNVIYVFSYCFLPSSWKHRNLPSYFDEDSSTRYLRLTFEYHN